MKEIRRKGFDGILLDNLDVYLLWGEEPSNAVKVLKWIKERFSGLIYVNLGAPLELIDVKEFGEIVDGAMREEVWYTYGVSG